MAIAGTWVREKYGPFFWHQFWRETSVAGTNLPWILYFPGGGWARNTPDAFYDDAVGEPIWANGGANDLWSGIGTYKVRGFIAGYARRFYDFTITGTPVNDPNNAYLGDTPTTPGLRGAGIRDGQRLVQYLKDNASIFGINPSAGLIMGASAGGVIAGAIAYAPTRAYYGLAHPTNGSPYLPYSSSRVRACHLRITPAFWSDYKIGVGNLAGPNFFGVGDQAQYDAIADIGKDSLSPGGVALSHGRMVPTYFYSHETLSTTAAQDPPFGGHVEPAWVTLTAYAVGDRVTEGAGADDAYYCYVAHTSGTSTRPGVGGSWQTVWEAYEHNPFHDPVNGELLKERVFDRLGGEYIFAHPASGHTYPDDVVTWAKIHWSRALSAS